MFLHARIHCTNYVFLFDFRSNKTLDIAFRPAMAQAIIVTIHVVFRLIPAHDILITFARSGTFAGASARTVTMATEGPTLQSLKLCKSRIQIDIYGAS